MSSFNRSNIPGESHSPVVNVLPNRNKEDVMVDDLCERCMECKVRVYVDEQLTYRGRDWHSGFAKTTDQLDAHQQ